MQGTRSKFIKVLFKEDVKMMESKKPTTMGFKMKGQCAALVDALMSCNPHYVRCLKPNDVKVGCADHLGSPPQAPMLQSNFPLPLLLFTES